MTNSKESGDPAGQTLPELFERQAAKRPDACAVVSGDERVTYRELNERGNQLARRLARVGSGPGALVGVCLERSIDALATLLAVLKTGAAYVPIDPADPADRIRFMLEDTGAAVVVGETGTLPRLDLEGVHFLALDRERSEMEREESSDLPLVGGPRELAYVMYTSGSTGKPKGVEIEHRGITRLVFGNDYTAFGPAERVLQVVPFTFDVATFEIWAPLLHGGVCVLYPGRVPTAAGLAREIRHHGVTVAWLTTSLFNGVVDESVESLRGLKELLIGGEALSATHVRRALAALPGTQLVNGYGPTECTTFACCYRIPSDWAGEAVPRDQNQQHTNRLRAR